MGDEEETYYLAPKMILGSTYNELQHVVGSDTSRAAAEAEADAGE